ncbi:MAG: phenylalanine--tRNA ligase subunit beta [Clostridia bacterium]|nr:phenylalanine--tRNA ligase subunit beta [Clostridia bacterium]
MKISVDWLKDYVDLKGITAKQIAEKLTQITCEVEAVVPVGQGLESVLVGKILTCVAHPQSDHLHLLTVDVGQAQPLNIVCGAPNARAGLMVAVATVGTVMPDGMKIVPSKIRGYESFGMCCSYAELGYKDDNDGIIELPAKTKIGTPITKVLKGLADDIIDIDNKSITNRPDLWGHYGIARELAVIFDRPLQKIDTELVHAYDHLPALSVKIEDEHCLSYGAIKVGNLTGIVSPDLMQNRLYKLGHNSHGFLVDVTNYVMLAFGNPLHAFDASAVDKISIGTVNAGTQFTTLKDNMITATKDMLFVKSNGQPVALAGVMGGKNSEITDQTNDVVFEIATFDAANIRRTSVAVGIRSDASMRYEKALDPELNWLAVNETLRLIQAYTPQAKVQSKFTRATSPAAEQPALQITVTKQMLNSFTGVDFSQQDAMVERKLNALGFAPRISADKIMVTVPSWRRWKDITSPADVIEEIIRNYGYQNIEPVAPRVAVVPAPLAPQAQVNDALKDLLAWKYAFSEVHTNIWYDTKALKRFGITAASYATIANPFNKDDDQIRSTMLPSMLTVAANNKNQNDVRVFEIGRVINQDGSESEHLAGVAVGMNYKLVSEMVTALLSHLGVEIAYQLQQTEEAVWHPTNHAQIMYHGVVVGSIGIIHPQVMTDAVGFEIDLSKIDFQNVAQVQAPILSKFPKTELDFTFVWQDNYAKLDAIWLQYHNPLVVKRRLKAVYGNKFTLTFTVSSTEKTLDKAEINKIHQEILDFAGRNNLLLG